MAGYREKMGEFSSVVTAAIVGLISFALWQRGVHYDLGKINSLLATPLSAGLSFSVSSFVLAVILGIPVRWFRSKIRY